MTFPALSFFFSFPLLPTHTHADAGGEGCKGAPPAAGNQFIQSGIACRERRGASGAPYNDIVWGRGGQVGSECGTDAGFVRLQEEGIRQELHGGVRPPEKAEVGGATLGSSPASSSSGRTR